MIAVPLTVLAAAAWLAILVRAGLMAARIYQIEEYMPGRFFGWSRQRQWSLAPAVLLAGSVALIVALAGLAIGNHIALIAAGWLLGAVAIHVLWRPLPAKKALVFTGRMRRMLAAGASVAVVLTALIAVLVLVLPPMVGAILVALTCLATLILSSALVVSGDVLMKPVEAMVQRRFLRRARQRISSYDPHIVAVAGSYGKTSTKHIIAQLLGHQIRTLATPKSYNTLMGISRTINDLLEPGHRLFVVEMDAYGTGEIAQSCALAPPGIAVVTSVGPQHLDRFGSIERIAGAIYEVIEALPSSGTAVMYAGDTESMKLADRAIRDGKRVITYGPAANAMPLDVTVDDVTVTHGVTRFIWSWPAKGIEHDVAIPLLGAHNALNVAAALIVVHLLGCPLGDAIRRAALLEPIPHRLQVMPRTSGVTVIDDSYNANPVGVHAGLDVLAEMQGRAKILVTPGMVELGPIEQGENRRYGEHAAKVCDHVILVGGPRVDSLYDGLRAGGLTPESIHRVHSLEEATAALSRLTANGDVVLFANDLPDTYSELA